MTGTNGDPDRHHRPGAIELNHPLNNYPKVVKMGIMMRAPLFDGGKKRRPAGRAGTGVDGGGAQAPRRMPDSCH